jgi:hypothetical protein
MATRLTKNIKRELLASNHGRTMIIELEPGDIVSFRYKGKRTRYEVSLHSCFTLAIMNKIQQEYMAKAECHKVGLTKRKPKQPSFNHFDTKLRMALRGTKG